MIKHAEKFILQPNWALFLIDLSVKPEDALRLAGLPLDAFSRKEFSVTASQYFDFWRAIETLAKVDHLALKIGQMITVELFDPAIFACICSPNLNIALQRLSHFKRLVGPMALQLDIDENRLCLELQFCNIDIEVPQSLILTELVFFIQLARICTRVHIIPKAIYVPKLPDHTEKYEAFLGVKLQKSQSISIHFFNTDIERPFLTSNSKMWSFFEPHLIQNLAELDHRVKIHEKVKAILLESLPAGIAHIDEIAQRLALSKRSLQRLLADEQTNFKTILDDTRKELAQYYLIQSPISINEISFLLGFQEVNSFFRAFKQWTKESPNTYRQKYSSDNRHSHAIFVD
ncbi:AraC family transcriptional regulator [Acinetobacter rathckeae]|uniref:AraC family transcriptional regulator n=1 Tax=Acinetobacter rathckeae TaxID=2605272 RepID=UPI001BB369A1|nr:AraC family transcriptional regulator [Acinetobacter rathckeae]